MVPHWRGQSDTRVAMELGKVMNYGSDKEHSFLERAKRWHVKVLNCDSPVNRSIQELAEKKKKKPPSGTLASFSLQS